MQVVLYNDCKMVVATLYS